MALINHIITVILLTVIFLIIQDQTSFNGALSTFLVIIAARLYKIEDKINKK